MTATTNTLSDLLEEPVVVRITYNGTERDITLKPPAEKDAGPLVAQYMAMMTEFRDKTGGNSTELSADDFAAYQERMSECAAGWLRVCATENLTEAQALLLVRKTGGARSALAVKCGELCGLDGVLTRAEADEAAEVDRSF